MKTDLLNVLKSTRIFSSLDNAELDKLLKKFKRVYLKKSKTLFVQGSFSNSLYLVISGKLAIILKRKDKEKKILNTIGPGETVGEMGALSNEPRTATVKALEDSVLLKLSSEQFHELTRRHPAILQETLSCLLKRSRNLIELVSNEERAYKQVVMIPANHKVSLLNFYEKLNSMMHTMEGVTIVSEMTDGIHSATEAQIKELISGLVEKKQNIFYFLSSDKTSLANIAFENVDVVYIVAENDAEVLIDPFVLKQVKHDSAYHHIKRELILLYENAKQRPHHTAKWLDLTKFELHHHVRMDEEKDWQRMLRFMCGQAVGVVLGGGGLRCWAHLGALRALEKAGIPIDMVGGTSAGSIVAGHYGLHQMNKDSIKRLQDLANATRKAVALSNLTWPAVSVFNSKDFTRKLYEVFGGEHIEDLWINCFCVSTNLSNFSQMVYRRGRLWKTIRSSASVPGIFPPVVIKGKLHTDGGILNNLPVDVMRRFIGPRGVVIAIELTHMNEDNTEYYFPPILTFWQTLLTKLRIINRSYRFPHFVDTFLKSLLAGASAKQNENSLAADLLISPDLSRFGILNVKAEQEPELIKIGYMTALKAINAWRRKSKES